jgi:hypothetical protein
LFVFSSGFSLIIINARIGEKPIMMETRAQQSFDIDTLDTLNDWLMAEALAMALKRDCRCKIRP